MEYESVLIVKPEVFIYKIPPRASNRGYRAADWNLKEPTWTGRMRLVAKGTACILKLEDKTSGALFANCPIDTYPGVAIEAVSDSSRYFVIRVQDDNGRSAFLGLGFGDRSDSFDLNVALQDHFKWVKNQEQIEKEKTEPKQELDLGFKEGETIKINMRITKKDGSDGPSRTGKNKGNSGVLPPPPGGLGKIAPPPAAAASPGATVRTSPGVSPAHRPSGGGSEWTDYASAGGNQGQQNSANANWVQF
ncbi:GL26866 [Drosophila persimilis]|uniref:NECAP-like protein CG9132 n=4 Tax=obscura group TaxID=32355 RepID=B5DLE6_DROPS|nr:NECAP-like protein CG9132 [Drosophila persimilis]XP_002133718.1 NECAP-like protein CG9132 [Drosophila pseudoobscura]XP_022211794.1 NECAP-like protein CG9132 [Drosophila obscura]XP_034138693.1 NECAP-like protein CG9132 [Drosophila guanche]XP_034138694.1 NECAP-like protein CG9132 [Drosophila guanche]XP_034671142.1 NECAP-like protein CG9132 [Drosophila subobscura]XP_034671143.1 NECAP-like protein CG9132 [Drosophila subobscura]EDW30590.1 GL26866 [Drosophila persimilis]SPP88599.1 blast:NECAP-